MMNVVPGHLRGNPSDGQLPVFRVRERPVLLRVRKPVPHRDVHPAQRRVGIQRRSRIHPFIERHPGVLVERLGGVGVLRQREAGSGAEGEFGLGQVDEDLAGAPFAGGVGSFELRVRPAFDQGSDLLWGFAERRERFEVPEIRTVWTWLYRPILPHVDAKRQGAKSRWTLTNAGTTCEPTRYDLRTTTHEPRTTNHVLATHDIKSNYLGLTRQITVWLPPGYRRRLRSHRYSVLYLNDGQN